MSQIEIVSVNAGLKTFLGIHKGKEVFSCIHKLPLIGQDKTRVITDGLVADCQQDQRVLKGKRVHGGPQKALYALPAEHIQVWSHLLKRQLSPGILGENLTICGITEADVFPGDRWQLAGGVILEVTIPRRPCFKLNMAFGPETARMMQQNGLCGWYFAVVKKGYIPTGHSTVTIIPNSKRQANIAALFARKVAEDPAIPGA